MLRLGRLPPSRFSPGGMEAFFRSTRALLFGGFLAHERRQHFLHLFGRAEPCLQHTVGREPLHMGEHPLLDLSYHGLLGWTSGSPIARRSSSGVQSVSTVILNFIYHHLSMIK